MYIAYDKETMRVAYIGEKKPIAFSNGLEIAEVETIPQNYDFLSVENVREETRTWVETVEELDELSDEVTKKEIEHTETFNVAEVKANFVVFTETQKKARYEAKVDRLVREKYSLSNELALLRQRDAKPEEFAEYDEYVELCKAIAKAEEETV